MSISHLLAISYLIAAAGAVARGFRIHEVPKTVCNDTATNYAGFYDFAQDKKHLFFWVAESRDDVLNDPVILWMSGGPGAASVGVGLFEEIGSCIMKTPDGTQFNPHAWNNRATVIAVDQPVSVGFSHAEQPVADLDEAMDDMYHFLTSFFERFPHFADNDFYIFGESYGGTWVPALARKIHHRQSSAMAAVVQSTSSTLRGRINLQGVGLGNAQMSQEMQWQGFYASGCASPDPLFNESACAVIEEHLPQCIRLMRECQSSDRDQAVCNNILQYCRERSVFFVLEAHRNPYDVRMPCDGTDCYPQMHWIEDYLNAPSTKMKLGVNADLRYSAVNMELNEQFAATGQQLLDSAQWVEELLDQGYRVLIYAGDKDWFCNVHGMRNLVHNLQWKHQPAFQTTELRAWGTLGKKNGWFKQYKNLAYVEVSNAGHMVPTDQPEAAILLVNSWIEDLALPFPE